MATPPSATTFIAGQIADATNSPGHQSLNDHRDAINFLQSPPLCVVTFSTAQPVSSGGAGLTVAWNQTTTDDSGMHSNTVNPSRITPSYAGWYVVTTSINWAANATGYRQVRVSQNGSTTWGERDVTATGSGQVASFTSIPTWSNGSTDYFEIDVFQNSGGSLNIQSAISSASVRWSSA